jgi:hypothetical protein
MMLGMMHDWLMGLGNPLPGHITPQTYTYFPVKGKNYRNHSLGLCVVISIFYRIYYMYHVSHLLACILSYRKIHIFSYLENLPFVSSLY